MTEVYRKHGRVARYENGHMLEIDEAGQAVEEATSGGITFSATPLGIASKAADVDAELVQRVADDLLSAIGSSARVERLIVSHGQAHHEIGDAVWEEQSRRIHLSLVRGGLRVIADRGDFELVELQSIARALGDAGAEREAPSRLRLAPNVAAALLPGLVGVAPPNVTLLQSGGGVDGKGNAVEELVVGAPPWPNWYRPSYRVRPMRALLNLRLECEVKAIDGDLPEAVALLSPVEGTFLHVLIRDGRAVYPCTLRVVRIDAVAEERIWYPYGTGAWGAEMML